jgi:entericidin B
VSIRASNGHGTTQSRNQRGEINMFKKTLMVLAALTTVALAACNTMEGAGKDVESAGKAIQGGARDAQQKM